MKLEAKATFSYGRKPVRVGEVFEADANDAELLLLTGRAIRARQEHESAALPQSPSEVPDSSSSKRRYKRRDMEAEE